MILFQLKALFVNVVTRAQARREGAKKVIEGLAAARQAKDDAAADDLLKKLREGLRQVSEGREAFLNAFDEILTATQRAAILLCLVQRAKDSGKPVEQLIDDVLIETGSSN